MKADLINTTQVKKNQLSEQVKDALEQYFEDLDGQQVSGVYQMVLRTVEKPLLETVMKHTRKNRSKASLILGMDRNTLRKKLVRHGIDN